jgi:hypothetical protein
MHCYVDKRVRRLLAGPTLTFRLRRLFFFRREAPRDGEAVTVRLQRARKVALRHVHVANLLVRLRQSALP